MLFKVYFADFSSTVIEFRLLYIVLEFFLVGLADDLELHTEGLVGGGSFN